MNFRSMFEHEDLVLSGAFIDWFKAYLIQYSNDANDEFEPVEDYWKKFPHKTNPPLDSHLRMMMGDFDIGFLRQIAKAITQHDWDDAFEEAFDYGYYNGIDIFCCSCTIQDPEARNRKPLIVHDRALKEPRCIRCGCTEYIWKFTKPRPEHHRGNDLEELKYLFKEAQTQLNGLEEVLSPDGISGAVVGYWLRERSGLTSARETRPGEKNPLELAIAEFFPKRIPT